MPRFSGAAPLPSPWREGRKRRSNPHDLPVSLLNTQLPLQFSSKKGTLSETLFHPFSKRARNLSCLTVQLALSGSRSLPGVKGSLQGACQDQLDPFGHLPLAARSGADPHLRVPALDGRQGSCRQLGELRVPDRVHCGRSGLAGERLHLRERSGVPAALLTPAARRPGQRPERVGALPARGSR